MRPSVTHMTPTNVCCVVLEINGRYLTEGDALSSHYKLLSHPQPISCTRDFVALASRLDSWDRNGS